MNLLIVDDVAINRKLLRAVLEAEGYDILEAGDGKEALASMERQPVDGIISDILMPNMDGYRLCYETRKDERRRDLPFIFYTATYTSPGDEKLAAASFAVHAREQLLKTENMRLLFSALDTMRGSVDPVFCHALLDRAKEFYAEAHADCDGAPETQSQTLRIGGAVVAAKLIKSPHPVYPPDAKARGITGTVHFQAMIGHDGKISDVELLGGPFALYDEARAAVLKWEYKPTTLNGKPVDVITTIDINFALNR